MALGDWQPLNPAKLETDLITFEKRIRDVILLLKEKKDLVQTRTPDETESIEELNQTIRQVMELKKLTLHLVSALQAASSTQSKSKKQNFESKCNEIISKLVSLGAFIKDQQLKSTTGPTAFWSKLNQTFAKDIAKEKQSITLESSFAGYLFDGLSWGTIWSTAPDAPMKKFWQKMSIAVAAAASQRENSQKIPRVDVYVLEHPIKESAFFTDEWPTIRRSISEGTLDALHLYQYELSEDKKNRPIFIRDFLPNESEIQKFDKSYVFVKGEKSVYYIQNGFAQKLTKPISYYSKNEKLRIDGQIASLMEIDSSDYPLLKTAHSAVIARSLISRHQDHHMWSTLNTSAAPIHIKTQEELELYIKPQRPAYKEYQQSWQNLQSAKGKARIWGKSFSRLHQSGALHTYNENYYRDSRSSSGYSSGTGSPALSPGSEPPSPPPIVSKETKAEHIKTSLIELKKIFDQDNRETDVTDVKRKN